MRARVTLATTAMLLVVACSAMAQEDNTYNIKSAETLQHTIDFLVTIALAAIAALGYVFKDSNLSPWFRFFQIAAGTLTLMCVLLSLIFSYKSYLDLVSDMGSGPFDYANLPNNYAIAAFTLLIAGILLFITLAITTAGHKQTTGQKQT